MAGLVYLSTYHSNKILVFQRDTGDLLEQHQLATSTAYGLALSPVDSTRLWLSDQGYKRVIEFIRLTGTWSPSIHLTFPPAFRQRVFTLMMVNRVGDVDFSVLPRELVYLIIAFYATPDRSS